MTIAYLFPGQGAQAVGMGKDLYDAVPAAKAIFDEADQALGFSLSQLCFEGPMEDLTQTINTQPAILTASVAALEAAREVLGDKGLTPSFAAGHSLGEYSALVASGSMTFSDAVKLVRERGRLMQAAGDAAEGAMAAVMGMPEDQLQAICEANGVDMANLNSAEQIVISGSKTGVEAAQKAAEEGGARRVVPLPVSAAFHSSLMDPAVPGMRTALEGASISAPTYPVVGNVTAQPLETADEVVDELARQIRSSVQWFRTVEYLRDNGVTTFIEIGPGKVLTGLVKRTFDGAETVNIGNLEELEALRA
ncbi:MAG: ACP S-malonyltransferase [Chloroflexi bacterium]|nr:ACP S-malonyltransferase [Chloroflexota bacterium]